MKSNKSTGQRGFSLLELSIVLVIIGLLAGGITVGQDMIRAAELRSVTEDIEKFKTAMYTFKDKYMALPGDMKNATEFWGAAHATPATCYTTVGTGTQTCDGDGNGIIQGSNFYEAYRFWQHLANAGLIEGNFTGTGNYIIHGPIADVGINVPSSKISGIGYVSLIINGYNIAANKYTSDYYTNRLPIVAGGGYAGSELWLKPEEAYSIDLKADDGKPASGNIEGHFSSGNITYSGCITDYGSTGSYRLNETSKTCSLVFLFN